MRLYSADSVDAFWRFSDCSCEKRGKIFVHTSNMYYRVLTGGGWWWCLFFFWKWPHRYHFVLMKGWWMLVSINEAVIMHTMVWFLSAFSVCLLTESKTFETSCTYLHWVVNIALSTAYHLPLYYFGTTTKLETNMIIDQYPCTGNLVKGYYRFKVLQMCTAF